MASPFLSHLLSLPQLLLPSPLFLFHCKQPTSLPRYYLFLTGFNKAGPKEETTTQLPKLFLTSPEKGDKVGGGDGEEAVEKKPWNPSSGSSIPMP